MGECMILATMMTITEFCHMYPDLCFDWEKLIRGQPRIYDSEFLKLYPEELEAGHFHANGAGRSRANPNQTKCHSQCATCQRVRRNDFFYTPPSQRKRNIVFTHCKDCMAILNAKSYVGRADDVAMRREQVLRYIAPRCLICGFDEDVCAIDMHHLGKESKEANISSLVTAVTFTPSLRNCSRLLDEASRCIPLCCRCHRMVHNSTRSAQDIRPLQYNLHELLRLLKPNS
jgi:hypothetical protein